MTETGPEPEYNLGTPAFNTVENLQKQLVSERERAQRMAGRYEERIASQVQIINRLKNENLQKDQEIRQLKDRGRGGW